jgi:hypothetical protein
MTHNKLTGAELNVFGSDGASLAEKPPRPELKTYEDVFQYALSKVGAARSRHNPAGVDHDHQTEDCA